MPKANRRNRRAELRGRKLRVGFLSLGCPKNRVDSESMLARLQKHGCTIVTDAARADVIIVNTCAFIESAKQESINAILEMARHKVSSNVRRLIVTGCLVQRHEAELRRAVPEIDAVLGTGQIEQIERAVMGEDTSVSGSPGWLPLVGHSRMLSTPPHLAYLKISEGCDYKCSFCVIPELRGRYRSRPLDLVVQEARELVGKGVQEIILVGQDTTRYGLDLGINDGLARLLRRLGEIESLRWIRIMYAHPATLNDEILDAIASLEKVVKYVDLPLQHASERILKRMRRPIGRKSLLDLTERMRERVPGLAIRTTFIVGFPGETGKDFEALLRFVEQARLDHIGVFTYSREQGTQAYGFRDQVPAATKEKRRREVLTLQQSIGFEINRGRVGEVVEVLVEASGSRGAVACGRLSTQAPDVDGAVHISEGTARSGEFIRCEIVQAGPYDLVARILSSSLAERHRQR